MIPLGDLLDWLGNPSGVDGLVRDLEERAVDIVERETERHFGTSETFTEMLTGSGEQRLWLAEAPSEITSVEERAYPGADWTTLTAAADDGYELRAPTSGSGVASLVRLGGYSWKYGYDYRVIYDFGYDEGAEPLEIRQAVLDLVAATYQQRQTLGLKSETIGDYSYTTSTEGGGDISSMPGLRRMLSRWRRKTRTSA